MLVSWPLPARSFGQALVELVRRPDPRLKQSCREVNQRDLPELRVFIDQMLDIMYTYEGVGLAAPQVGWNIRVIVVDPSNGEDDKACRVMINPSFESVSLEKEVCMEGCLSLPGEFYNVERSTSILARWQDLDGASHESWLYAVEARIVLHELDHLTGILISDHGSKKRK